MFKERMIGCPTWPGAKPDPTAGERWYHQDDLPWEQGGYDHDDVDGGPDDADDGVFWGP